MTIIDGYIEFTYVENRGAVFGLFNNQESNYKHYILSGFTFLSILFMIFVIWRLRELSFFYHLPFFIILAGASGNLIDRIRFGRVVDFIHIHWKDIVDWPFLFNIADVLIIIGGILLLIILILKKEALENRLLLK